MENPARPPITVYKMPERELRLAQLKKGLSIEDQHIADRLESLRRSNHSSHHDDASNSDRRKSTENPEKDIEARLARLKGV
jgi:hypothetical protein